MRLRILHCSDLHLDSPLRGGSLPATLRFFAPSNPRSGAAVSRQIAYTALTRAKKVALLWGDAGLLELAAARREDRLSRLRGTHDSFGRQSGGAR